MEGGSEVAFGEREHQSSDAAAGAVESCHGVEGAWQAEPRRAAEDEIGDADGEEQGVASENDLGACSLLGGKPSCSSFCIACDVFCGKKKPPESGRLLSFRIVHDLEGLRCAAIVVDTYIKRALNQRETDWPRAEEGEGEIDEREVVVNHHIADLLCRDDVLAHLIKPIKTIDTAGENCEENNLAARSRSALSSHGIGILCECIEPVKAIDAAGKYSEDDSERNRSFCHEYHPFCREIGIFFYFICIHVSGFCRDTGESVCVWMNSVGKAGVIFPRWSRKSLSDSCRKAIVKP